VRLVPPLFIVLLAFSLSGCDMFDLDSDPIEDNSPPIKWSFTLDEFERSKPASIIETNDDNFVVAGQVSKDGNDYQSVLYMFKFDKQGNKKWLHDYEEIDIIISNMKMVGLENGNILIGGSSTSTTPRLQKFDLHGNLLWQRDYSEYYSNRVDDLIATSDGGALIVSRTENDSLREFSIDVLLLKTNSDGDLDWQFNFQKLGTQIGTCATELPNGNIVVFTENLTGANTDNVFGVCVSSEGILVDTLEIQLEYTTRPKVCKVLPSDDIILAGITGNIFWNSFALTIGDNLEVTNEQYYGGIGSDVIYGMDLDDRGGLIYTGYTNNFGAGNYDIWVFKTGDNGSVLWQKALGKEKEDIGKDIVTSSDGDYIVTGILSSSKTYIACISGD